MLWPVDVSPELLAALDAEIARKDKQLAAFDVLRAERDELLKTRERWMTGSHSDNGSAHSANGAPTPTNGASKRNLAPRFEPDENSRTSRALKAARDIIGQQIASRRKPSFLSVFASLPDEFKTGNHPREFFRTALQRSGGRYGIIYAKADDIRLADEPGSRKEDPPGP
jgi:hypothetical protein